MIALTILLILTAVAAWTDFKQHTIFNWTTYPGMLAGLSLNASGLGEFSAGWDGAGQAAAGFAACGFIMLAALVFFDVGGGDVKLIAMMGAFLGLESATLALLWTFSIGFVFGSSVLIWRVGIGNLLKKTVEQIRLVVKARGWVPLSTDEKQPLKQSLFLAPSALIAVLIVGFPRFAVYLRDV